MLTLKVPITEMREHLEITTQDKDPMLGDKILAAQTWIEQFIGIPLEEFDELPPPIREAIKQLAAHLFENREATIVGMSMEEVSPGLFDLLAPYREWTFRWRATPLNSHV